MAPAPTPNVVRIVDRPAEVDESHAASEVEAAASEPEMEAEAAISETAPATVIEAPEAEAAPPEAPTPVEVAPAPEALHMFKSHHLVFDMVYGPQETSLVHFSRKKGAKAVDGLLMLLHQGVFAFEIWFGKPAPATVMRQALFAAAGRRGN